jgi:cytochrome c-type biogenesis protein CcmF
LQDVKARDSLPKEVFGDSGSLHEASLKIFSKTGSIFSVQPRLAVAKGEMIAVPDTITSESLIVRLERVNADKTIELGVKESNSVLEYITLKAYKFPYINILWLGIVIMATGIIISMVRRIQLNNSNSSES